MSVAGPDGQQGLAEAITPVGVLGHGDFDVPAIEHLDHAQVAFVAGELDEQLQRYVLAFAEHTQQCRPSAAGTLPPPTPSAIGGGQDTAQCTDRPAVPVVNEFQGVDRQVLAGGRHGPTSSGVGRVQHSATRLPGDPAFRPTDLQGGEVEEPIQPVG